MKKEFNKEAMKNKKELVKTEANSILNGNMKFAESYLNNEVELGQDINHNKQMNKAVNAGANTGANAQRQNSEYNSRMNKYSTECGNQE